MSSPSPESQVLIVTDTELACPRRAGSRPGRTAPLHAAHPGVAHGSHDPMAAIQDAPARNRPNRFTHAERLMPRGDGTRPSTAAARSVPPVAFACTHRLPAPSRPGSPRSMSATSMRRPAINEQPPSDAVVAWRSERLRSAGLADDLAAQIACDRSSDLHAVLDLVKSRLPC
jgi:hypothetical protein